MRFVQLSPPGVAVPRLRHSPIVTCLAELPGGVLACTYRDLAGDQYVRVGAANPVKLNVTATPSDFHHVPSVGRCGDHLIALWREVDGFLRWMRTDADLVPIANGLLGPDIAASATLDASCWTADDGTLYVSAHSVGSAGGLDRSVWIFKPDGSAPIGRTVVDALNGQPAWVDPDSPVSTEHGGNEFAKGDFRRNVLVWNTRNTFRWREQDVWHSYGVCAARISPALSHTATLDGYGKARTPLTCQSARFTLYTGDCEQDLRAWDVDDAGTLCLAAGLIRPGAKMIRGHADLNAHPHADLCFYRSDTETWTVLPQNNRDWRTQRVRLRCWPDDHITIYAEGWPGITTLRVGESTWSPRVDDRVWTQLGEAQALDRSRHWLTVVDQDRSELWGIEVEG